MTTIPQDLPYPDQFEVGKLITKEINSTIKYVKDSETIQNVIDSITDSSITKPYVVRVPPGTHFKESYSTVGKPYIKVIYEDNPDDKFQIVPWDRCESLTGWTISGTGWSLAIDSTHKTEGDNCFYIHSNAGGASYADIIKTGLNLDWRGYNGILFDFEVNTAEITYITPIVYIGTPNLNFQFDMFVPAGTQKGKNVFMPFIFDADTTTLNGITEVRMRLSLKAAYTGTVDAYIDNIRLIRTTPCKTAILRYDDGLVTQWNNINYIEKRGWKGNFGVYSSPIDYNAAFMTTDQLKKLHSNGHEIINHSSSHVNFSVTVDKPTAYSEIINCKNWLQKNGFVRSLYIFIDPYTHSNEYAMNCLQENGMISAYNKWGRYPSFIYSVSDTAFTIPTIYGDDIGGIHQFLIHTITNTTNYETFLAWVEANYSKVITLKEALDMYPDDFELSIISSIIPGGNLTTMTGAETFTIKDGSIFIKDPGGAARTFNPSGTFPPFYQVTVINTADAAEPITFDSTGLNLSIAQNQRGIFAYSGTDWLKVFIG